MAIGLALWLAIFAGLGRGILLADPPQDRIVIGSDFVLPAGSQMEGNVMIIGGEARIEVDARLNGDLMVLGGSVIIDGRVEGDVVALGPRVRLGTSARVRGDLVTLPSALERSSGSIVEGNLVMVTAPPLDLRELLPTVVLPERGLIAWADRALRMVLGGFVLILLALIVATLFPGPVAQNARTLEQAPMASLGIGMLVLLLGVLGILILVITILGIPLALIALGLLIGAFLFGFISFGYLVGTRLVSSLPSGWPPVTPLLVGVAIVWLLWSLADLAPFCGGFVIHLALTALALGSTFLSRFGARPYPPRPAVPSETQQEGTAGG